MLRLTLLATAVVDNRLANPEVANNPESVLRRVMPLAWQAQGAVFAGRYSAYRVRHWAVTAGGAIVASRFGSRWLHKLRFAISASPNLFDALTPLTKVRVFPLKK